MKSMFEVLSGAQVRVYPTSTLPYESLDPRWPGRIIHAVQTDRDTLLVSPDLYERLKQLPEGGK